MLISARIWLPPCLNFSLPLDSRGSTCSSCTSVDRGRTWYLASYKRFARCVPTHLNLGPAVAGRDVANEADEVKAPRTAAFEAGFHAFVWPAFRTRSPLGHQQRQVQQISAKQYCRRAAGKLCTASSRGCACKAGVEHAQCIFVIKHACCMLH
jgi:hypothetical protein